MELFNQKALTGLELLRKNDPVKMRGSKLSARRAVRALKELLRCDVLFWRFQWHDGPIEQIPVLRGGVWHHLFRIVPPKKPADELRVIK